MLNSLLLRLYEMGLSVLNLTTRASIWRFRFFLSISKIDFNNLIGEKRQILNRQTKKTIRTKTQLLPASPYKNTKGILLKRTIWNNSYLIRHWNIQIRTINIISRKRKMMTMIIWRWRSFCKHLKICDLICLICVIFRIKITQIMLFN